MKIQDAVTYMSTAYLRRILDSYLRDSRKPEEEEARQRIIQDQETLEDPENIEGRLELSARPFNDRLLTHFIAETLLSEEAFTLDANTLVTRVQELEQAIITEAEEGEALKLRDPRNLDIYREVMRVALEDEAISLDEKRLLRRLRESLGLGLRDHYRIQAQLGYFPKPGNQIHTSKEIDEGFRDLQTRGVAFWCNRHPDGGRCVIPEEIAPGLKRVLGVELPRQVFRDLLDQSLSRAQLQEVLRERGLPVSGKKEQLAERILAADLNPSEVLSSLGVHELAEICRELPGVPVSGSKDERIRNIIDHYDNLRLVRLEASSDPRESYFHFLTELASRDRENLLANRVIGKDLEIERAFEEGTRYLFEEILGIPLLTQSGNKHADGAFRHPNTGALFLWDNKSKESDYDFPGTDYDQFKRYIRDSDERVTAFVVIVPSYKDEAADVAAPKLKSDSGTDTDVCLVTAEDLRWLAERVRGLAGPVNPDIFNYTGGLERKTLEKRLKAFS